MKTFFTPCQLLMKIYKILKLYMLFILIFSWIGSCPFRDEHSVWVLVVESDLSWCRMWNFSNQWMSFVAKGWSIVNRPAASSLISIDGLWWWTYMMISMMTHWWIELIDGHTNIHIMNITTWWPTIRWFRQWWLMTQPSQEKQNEKDIISR